MNHPNFMVIGAQKTGTTYLCKSLDKHPDVFIPKSKELFFFTKDGLTEQDYANYLSTHFKAVNGRKLIGEGSTTYLQWPRADININRLAQQPIKFIICLRQPTEKAVSFYIHNWQRGRYEHAESILSAGGDNVMLSPIISSRYYDSLRRWFSLYPKKQFKIILFDLLQKDPEAFVTEATKFLGISALSNIDISVVNAGKKLIWDNDYLTIAPSHNKTDMKPPRFSKKELEKLHNELIDDVDKTSELLNIDLSLWKIPPTFV